MVKPGSSPHIRGLLFASGANSTRVSVHPRISGVLSRSGSRNCSRRAGPRLRKGGGPSSIDGPPLFLNIRGTIPF